MNFEAMPPTPTVEWSAWDKAIVRNLNIPGISASGYLVISQRDPARPGYITLRLIDGSRSAVSKRFEGDEMLMTTRTQVRLLKFGKDNLVGFWTHSGDANVAAFVRISAHPLGIQFLHTFQDPSIHHFQATEELDEHLRLWQRTRSHPEKMPKGLYTRTWKWNSKVHQFVELRHFYSHSWKGWNDLTIK